MDIDSMTIADLKRELKARNLPLKGTKTVLADRLRFALSQPQESAALVLSGDDQTHEEDISDEVLLNEEDLLKGSPEPPIKKEVLPSISSIQLESASDAAVTTAPSFEGATSQKLTKDSALQTIEDAFFSAKPAAPGLHGSSIKKNQSLINKSSAPVLLGAARTSITTSSLDEKLQARAARFGLDGAAVKLMERAKKFGPSNLTGLTGATPVVDKQKLLDRAKRFRLSVGEDGRSITEGKDLEKLRKRAARFGCTVSSVVAQAEVAERLAKRKAKFASGAVACTTPFQNSVSKTTDSSVPTSEPSNPKRKRIVF